MADNSVYWDACVFIDLLEQTPGRYDACDFVRSQATKNQLIIVTSALTIVEVNKLPDQGSLPEEQSKKIIAFFENPYIAIRPLDRTTAELAHELTRTHGLMPGDAVHVATALLAKVDVFHTYDRAKKRRKGLLRYNGMIGTPPLKIEVPPEPTAGPLFEQANPPDTASAAKASSRTRSPTQPSDKAPEGPQGKPPPV